MEIKRSARMTAIPQLDVPEILVDNDEDKPSTDKGGGAATSGPLSPGPLSPAFLSADDAHTHHHRSWSNISADLSSYDTSYGHPLAGPRASGPSSPGHRGQPSAFSFELSEAQPDYSDVPIDDGAGDSGAGHRASAVSPAQVREMLDDSVWMASIRRSATMNRRGPDLGWGGGGPGGF